MVHAMSARDVIAAVLPTPGPMNRNAEADAILAALSAAGYAVVPVEPTEAMNIAGREARRSMGANIDVYQAMIVAAREETP